MSIFSKTKLKNNKTAVKEQEKENIKPTAIKPVSNQLAFLLRQAWVTEKSGTFLNLRKYVFIVDKKANKPQVAKAVEAIYGVKVSDVNIVNRKPKTRRLGRTIGVISGRKKAIVTLKEGHKIDLMPV